MNRLRRQDAVVQGTDRRIEERALQLVKAGHDWLSAVLEATRELQGGARPRGRAPGKMTRSWTLPAPPRRGRRGEARDAATDEADAGPTLSLSLRAQLA